MKLSTVLLIVLLLLALAALALLIAGQLGLLRGSMPADLGPSDGRLKPPSATENSASSQATLHEGAGARYARIEPLRYGGDGAAGSDGLSGADAMTRLGAIVLKMPGARIMQSGPDYLYVQFETRWLKFVDDAEFWAPAAEPGVIHVRSASRVGRKDFGVNRARIERIRAAFESATRQR